MREFLLANIHDCIALLGVVCLSVGVGLYDARAGLALFGALLVAGALYGAQLVRGSDK